MNYANSLNSVSSTPASSTSASSSYASHSSLQHHTQSLSPTVPSPNSTASMAAAMFYQQQQAAVAAAGFDAAAAAAAAVASNPSGHHQGPLAAAAATAALSNNMESPRYPWMSITGMFYKPWFNNCFRSDIYQKIPSDRYTKRLKLYLRHLLLCLKNRKINFGTIFCFVSLHKLSNLF